MRCLGVFCLGGNNIRICKDGRIWGQTNKGLNGRLPGVIYKLKITKKGRNPNSIGRPFQPGDKHPRWLGGKTKLLSAIRNSFEYRLWRSDVYKRDNYTCQECGIKGVKMHAHHIFPLFKIVDRYGIKTLDKAISCSEILDVNNGQTLCEMCHKKTNSYLNRKV